MRRARFALRAPTTSRDDEAEPSSARRCHLRVLGNPARLHPHRPLRLHRSLEPPRSRRGHDQASGARTLLHRTPSSFAMPTSSSTSTSYFTTSVHPRPSQIWDEVYGSGRHFLGVGKRFHTFPMDYRLVDFSWMTMATSYGDTFYDAPSLVGRTPQAPAPPPAPAPAPAPRAPASRPSSSPSPSPTRPSPTRPSHTPHVKRRTPHG